MPVEGRTDWKVAGWSHIVCAVLNSPCDFEFLKTDLAPLVSLQLLRIRKMH